MILGREPNGVAVAISPRERFDRLAWILCIELGPQDRAVTTALTLGAFDRRHGGSGALGAERGITACFYSPSGVEHVLTEHDVLAGDVLLIRPVTIVATNHAAIGR